MKMTTQTLLADPPIGKTSYYLQPTRAASLQFHCIYGVTLLLSKNPE
jgi:hypothetical protein